MFKIKGIEINFHYTLLFGIGYVAWAFATSYYPVVSPGSTVPGAWIAGFLAAVMVFGSVLVHELAHSLTAMSMGIKVERITLHLFGGVSELVGEMPSWKKEFLVAAAGPLASLAVAVFVFFFSGHVISRYLFIINASLFLFNLYPAFPLDGGRMLRSLFWRSKKNFAFATMQASAVGIIFAILVMFAGFILVSMKHMQSGTWLILVGGFLFLLAYKTYKQVWRTDLLALYTVGSAMVPGGNLVAVPHDCSLYDLYRRYYMVFGYGQFPVVKEGVCVGLVSIGRIFYRENIIYKNMDEFKSRTVEEVMTPFSWTDCVDVDENLENIYEKMLLFSKNHLFVTDDGRPAGMIFKSTILRMKKMAEMQVKWAFYSNKSMFRFLIEERRIK